MSSKSWSHTFSEKRDSGSREAAVKCVPRPSSHSAGILPWTGHPSLTQGASIGTGRTYAGLSWN